MPEPVASVEAAIARLAEAIAVYERRAAFHAQHERWLRADGLERTAEFHARERRYCERQIERLREQQELARRELEVSP